MKVLAEISAGSSSELRGGTIRRQDLAAFRSLLGGLRDASTVLVTGPGDHRRAAAVGLAAAAASNGARTALVECDLAEPALSGLLGLAATPGLHEYLRWEVGVADILQPLVLAGPASAGVTEPLVCVVAGRAGPNGEVLLGSASFSHASQRLRAAYDVVVLDGPPLASATGLYRAAALADVVVACLGWEEARGRSARYLKRGLRRLPARFAGAIAVS